MIDIGYWLRSHFMTPKQAYRRGFSRALDALFADPSSADRIRYIAESPSNNSYNANQARGMLAAIKAYKVQTAVSNNDLL